MTHHTTLIQRCRERSQELSDLVLTRKLEEEFLRLERLREDKTSNFQDVGAFHEKFGLPVWLDRAPCLPAPATMSFRIGFMVEELAEFCEASGYPSVAEELKAIMAGLKSGRHKAQLVGLPDLCLALDALCDLNYVSLGTAHFMGLPFDEAWAEVQRANMSKERSTGKDDPRSTRGSALDVVKPEGWRKPDHEPAITAHLKRMAR